VVVDNDGSRLFVIDYGLAEYVDGSDHVVHGYVGTDGFMAPEVRRCEKRDRPYCAIPADLWATGNILEFIMDRCDEPNSPAVEALWSISRLLMNDDPEERPGAGGALAMLSVDTLSISPDLAVTDTCKGPHTAPKEWTTQAISLIAH
jgi:serine/threonine protein kinase